MDTVAKIPAVTGVEEWTRVNTGVGADMAAGSQSENGICPSGQSGFKIWEIHVTQFTWT